ncbi:LOW QUALITY PROTEIN: WD repeat-containing protein WRAP73-like [Portunus trituberculatus]|uniref:LOW QUALITY PROTEIN: WD repeat-containing protein WRAP73-like n=1 Tax=Portunus trituberculatus TaxID=210409 RepID=UPI001E1CE4E9|nr:LOW QUALITY PROTEIN: WD repeat-containing protein WRAP73-like [Portunus trituberculatus]
MNFSEVLGASLGGGDGGAAVAWAGDGRLVAWPSPPSRLQVRDSATLQVIATFNCADAVQEIAWAPDSQYLLSVSYKRGIVEVWAVGDPGWRCRVEGGSGGVIAAQWSPDSRHVLITAEFYVRVRVWSLVRGESVCCVARPKRGVAGGLFQPWGFLVVAQRKDCRDYLTIYETQDWTLVKTFPVCTRDLVGVAWGCLSPTHTPGHPTGHPRGHPSEGSLLIVWDSNLDYNLALYSLSGHCLGSYSAYDMALGVSDCALSPSRQFLAVSSHDHKVRLLSYPPQSGSRVTPPLPSPPPPPPPASVWCTRKVEHTTQDSPQLLPQHATPPSPPSPWSTTPPKTAPPQPPPRQAPMVAFSSDGRYLATRRLDMPCAVWIWDISSISLKAVLVHEDSVKDLAWDPKSSRLALVTGGCHVFFWSPLGTVAVAVPSGPHLRLGGLRWHPFGRCLLVYDRKHLSVCFLNHPHPPTTSKNP